jgi:hypothetical protein
LSGGSASGSLTPAIFLNALRNEDKSEGFCDLDKGMRPPAFQNRRTRFLVNGADPVDRRTAIDGTP